MCTIRSKALNKVVKGGHFSIFIFPLRITPRPTIHKHTPWLVDISMVDYFMVYNLKFDGWALIGAWAAIETDMILISNSFSWLYTALHFTSSCYSLGYNVNEDLCTAGLSNLSMLNYLWAAHCKSCLNLGHMKQTLHVYRFLKNFKVAHQSTVN